MSERLSSAAKIGAVGVLLACALGWEASASGQGAPAGRSARVAASSSPDFFFPIGDKTLFLASTEETGVEPWASDATAEGTRLLMDLCPGPCAARAFYPFARVGRQLFFGVVSHAGRSELWATAGTPETTRRLSDGPGRPGGGYSYPAWTEFGGRLYYSWRDPMQGNELWSSDGTPTGTRRVIDLRPGPRSSDPGDLVPFGGRLWFSANDGEHGRSIYRSDGTARGTERIAVPARGQAGGIHALSGKLVFSTGGVSQTLWSLSSNTVSPEKLFDLVPSFGPFSSYQRVVHRGKLLFAGRPAGSSRGLWATDGTVAGTRRIYAFKNNVRSLALLPYGGSEFGDRYLFQLFRGDRAAPDGAVRKIELWATDGTSAGTGRIADLCRGECFEHNSWILADGPRAHIVMGSIGPTEIWSTDGTADGTRQIAKGLVAPLGSAGPDFYFSRVSRGTNTGPRLDVWASDGTVEGTRPVTRPPVSPVLDFVWGAGPAQGKLLFAGYDELHGIELWVSDGTEEGTHLLLDLDPSERSRRDPSVVLDRRSRAASRQSF